MQFQQRVNVTIKRSMVRIPVKATLIFLCFLYLMCVVSFCVFYIYCMLYLSVFFYIYCMLYLSVFFIFIVCCIVEPMFWITLKYR
jgi:hypothetical protein